MSTGFRKRRFAIQLPLRAVVLAVTLAGTWMSVAAAGLDPRGFWLNEKGTVAVTIAPCDGEEILCGHIIWLEKPYRDNGELKRDGDRPYCGLPVLRGMKPAGKDLWSGGSVYDPDSGKTYKSRMRLKGPDTLEVHGYVLIPLLGRTLVWHRVPEPPGPCPSR